MPIVKLRERGQVTIPAELRNALGLAENDLLNVVKVGNALVLTQKQLPGDSLSKKMNTAMKKKGLTLEDLLKDRDKERITRKKRMDDSPKLRVFLDTSALIAGIASVTGAARDTR
jgi:AbrB family looped-hinge helix DNA binding protein